jgi:hypothetical protein
VIFFSETEGMETFEIKLEVNGNQDDYYSMESCESGNEQLVSFQDFS